MPDFAGLRVVAFEGRRVEEVTRLIEAFGGVPVSVPAMRLELLEAGPGMVELASRLRAGELDGMLFLSDTGVRNLAEVMRPVMGRSELMGRLGEIPLGARSPRVAEALEELGLTGALVPDPPHTWKALVDAFDRQQGLAGQEIAYIEPARLHSRLQAELMDRGAQVLQIAVYRWTLPEDPMPLVEAAESLAQGTIRVALFTSATQIENLMGVAAERDLDEPLREALRNATVGAIGALCVDRLRAFGIEPDVVPEQPRLDELVEQTARRAEESMESR